MNISSQTSAGLSSNVGIGDAQAQPGQPNTAQNNTGSELLPGTSNLTYSNSQQNSASKTLATLGHGNISIGGTVLEQNGTLTDAGLAADSALTGLNRDTANTDKELWNSDYSQDVDVTVDHRLLTETGRAEIAAEAEKFGENIQIVASTMPSAHDSNLVLSYIGEALDLLSYVTVGILPSDGFNGGLIANIPVWLGDNDIHHKVLQVVTAGSTYYPQTPINSCC